MRAVYQQHRVVGARGAGASGSKSTGTCGRPPGSESLEGADREPWGAIGSPEGVGRQPRGAVLTPAEQELSHRRGELASWG